MGGAVNPVAVDAVRERISGTYGAVMTLTLAPTFTGKIVFADPLLNNLREKAAAVTEAIFDGDVEDVRWFAEQEGCGRVRDMWAKDAKAVAQLLLAIEEMFSGF